MTSLPYSMTLDKDVGETVRRIAGPPAGMPEHDAFRSSIMAYPSENALWREARRDEETNLWTVIEHHRVPVSGSSNDAVGGQRIVFRHLCFFDALYSCAEFQDKEKVLGVAAADEIYDDYSSLPLFGAAAEAANQPLSKHGFPLPAANGYIIVFFDLPPVN